MNFLDEWRTHLPLSCTEFARLAVESGDIDLVYGLMPAAVLWPVRHQLTGGTGYDALFDLCGGRETNEIIKVIRTWGNNPQIAAQDLARRARASETVRAGLDTLVRYFDVVPSFESQVPHHYVARNGGNFDSYREKFKAGILNIGGTTHIQTLNIIFNVDHFPAPPLPVPFTFYSLPGRLVERPAETERLLALLLAPSAARAISIYGGGGFGKTTLALYLCHQARVKDAFSDGILWIRLGPSPDLMSSVLGQIELLSREQRNFSTLDTASARLRQLLAGKRVLLVLDDVWQESHVRPFLQENGPCRLLITTRQQQVLTSIEAAEVGVNEMTGGEAASLLGQDLNLPAAEDREAVEKLADYLGRWPLLLQITAARLRHRVNHNHLPVARAVAKLRQSFEEQGFTAFDETGAGDRKKAISISLDLSLDYLRELRPRFLELAVFPEGSDVPFGAIERLWSRTARFSASKTFDTIEKMQELSLFSRCDLDQKTLGLQPVIRDYLERKLGSEMPLLHRQFLDAYRQTWQGDGWHTAPDDGYLYPHLAYHLHHDQQSPELRQLLLDFNWLQAKLEATGLHWLLADYRFTGTEPPMAVVRRALQRAAHVLDDPRQLAGQLVGRLSGDDAAEIQAMLAQARQWQGAAWFCPLTPSLASSNQALVRTIGEHNDEITALAVDRAGNWLVAAAKRLGAEIIVWDLRADTLFARLSGHERSSVRTLVVSPDGKWVVAGLGNGKLVAWELQTGQIVRTFAGPGGSVNAAVLTPDGRRLISGHAARQVKVWEMDSGQLARTISGFKEPVQHLALTSDGARLIIASGPSQVFLADLQDPGRAEPEPVIKHGSRITALAAGLADQFFIGTEDGTIKITSLPSAKKPRKLKGHREAVKVLLFDPLTGQLISGGNDSEIKVWNIDSGAELQTLTGHSGGITALALTPGGRLASGSRDCSVKLWDLKQKQEPPAPAGHKEAVRAVGVTPDGEHAISASANGTLGLWALRPDIHLERSIESGTSIQVLACPGSKQFITGSARGEFVVWDLDRGTAVETIVTSHRGMKALAASPDGHKILAAGHDRSLGLWELGRETPLALWQTFEHPLLAVALLSKAEQAIVASGNVLIVWDLVTGDQVRAMAGQSGGVNAIALTPDETGVISAAGDGTLKLWDIATGEERKFIRAHEQAVNDVVVTADGSYAVSASSDCTIKLWELAGGTCAACLAVDAAVYSCAVAADGSLVIAGDKAGRLHFLRPQGL